MSLMKKQETTRAYDEVKKTTCGNCPAGCGLKVFLHKGKVVDIFGDEEHPINKGSVCPKGLLTHFHLGHPKRIVTAGIRRSTSEDFTQVSWNECSRLRPGRIGTAYREARERVGRALYGSESDPFEYLMGATWFAREIGMTVHTRETFPGPGIPARQHSREDVRHPAEPSLTNHPRDWCNSKCIVLYASDLARSDPITFGPIIDATRPWSHPGCDRPSPDTHLLDGVHLRDREARNAVHPAEGGDPVPDRPQPGRPRFHPRGTPPGSTPSFPICSRYTIERVAETCRIDASAGQQGWATGSVSSGRSRSLPGTGIHGITWRKTIFMRARCWPACADRSG